MYITVLSSYLEVGLNRYIGTDKSEQTNIQEIQLIWNYGEQMKYFEEKKKNTIYCSKSGHWVIDQRDWLQFHLILTQ